MEYDGAAKVLVVEDNAFSLQALQEALAGQHYEVASASSGEEALRRLLSEDFAAILLDVHLPGIDGFETAELIRKRRRSGKTPIIFLTGVHPEAAHMFRGYEVGAVDYMVKPIVPEVLRSKVAVFVDLYIKNAQIEAQNDQLRALAQRSEQRFYELVQGLDAIVWESQVNHRYTFVSQRAEGILGYPIECWFADANFRATLLHPEDRRSSLEAYQRAVRDHQSAVIEYRVYRASGELAWMRDHVHPVRDGKHVHLRGVMVDVSGHKQTEQRLQEQAEQLERTDRHRNEFLAMLGHELRNPLAPIQSAVEWLRLQQGRNGADIGWGIEAIGRQVEHMTRLVDDLLDVARITGGKIALQRQRCDLNQVVQRAIETVSPLIAAKDQSLSTALASRPVFVDADPVRLAQVIANLLHNAAKYTQERGAITVHVEQQGRSALVRVGDNGIGIARSMLGRVFDLFTQVPVDTRHASGGLGVGLTLVRRLVEMHGGCVHAHSAGPGHGSEFVVQLPSMEEARSEGDDAADREALDNAGKHLRILVVDDNADAAKSLAMLLEALGHEVQMVGDGPEALAVASRFTPAVVFLDIGLPGMDGYEVARRLRTSPTAKGSRLVALTGFGRQHADNDRALFDHFLLKPASLNAIQGILNTL